MVHREITKKFLRNKVAIILHYDLISYYILFLGIL